MSSFKRMVQEYFDDEESKRAHSYDASGYTITPSAIVRPSSVEQLRRIIVHANQHRIPLVPRGAGTGTRAGVLLEDATILDMRNFATLEKLDKQLHTITVGAGTPIGRLNETLKTYGYYVPLHTISPYSTIGGLVARGSLSLFPTAYGDTHELVQEVECFDGLGRISVLKGEAVSKVVGKEGTTGIITRVKIKVAPVKKLSLTVIEVAGIAEAIAEASRLDSDFLSLEFVDSIVSEQLGLGKENHLLCVYENNEGTITDEIRVKEILERKNKLPNTLWSEGFTLIESALLNKDGMISFAEFCNKHELPYYGDINTGVLFTHLHSLNDQSTFWNTIVAMGGKPCVGMGYGRTAVSYTPPELRKEVLLLKDERDYNNILNPGVIVSAKRVTNSSRETVADSVRHAIFEEENDAFLSTRDWRLSNRHTRFLLSKGVLSPWFFKLPVYNRNTLDDDILDARARLVQRGAETAANKEIIERLRKGKSGFK